MSLLLVIALLIAALACVLTGAMAGQLQSSDPAGNGLAQAYFVFALALTWLLVAMVLILVFLRAPAMALPAPLSWSMIGIATGMLFLLAVAGQFIGMRWLFDAANKGGWRHVLSATAAVVPLAFVVFAAWRGGALPVPAMLATWGCGAVVVVGSLLPISAGAFTALRAKGPHVLTVFDVSYPALLLNGEKAVRVLRYAEDLEQVRTNPAEPFSELLLVDADRTTYSLGRTGEVVDVERNAEPIDFDTLCARLLRMPRLDPEPEKDAELRRLIALQRDVTALSFVLPR